jgi:hypothetical protein
VLPMKMFMLAAGDDLRLLIESLECTQTDLFDSTWGETPKGEGEKECFPLVIRKGAPAWSVESVPVKGLSQQKSSGSTLMFPPSHT